MTAKEAAEAIIEKSMRSAHRTQRDIATWARRKKQLDKLRDAEIVALLQLCIAFRGHADVMDHVFDEICDRMSEDRVYEQMEMLCYEVLELRKRLRRLGMDSNWEPRE